MINRFIEAQQNNYSIALEEIRKGRKESHWMWYIFPQIHSLGKSKIAVYYSIKSMEEAIEYLNNKFLSNNLYEIISELLKINNKNINNIFNEVDSIKLRSSMTLFDYIFEEYNHLIITNKRNVFIEVM